MPLLGDTGPDSLPLGFASLFEAFAKNIIELAQSSRELWASTAIAVSPFSMGVAKLGAQDDTRIFAFCPRLNLL